MLRIVLLLLMSTATNSESFEAFINQPLEQLAGVYFENLGDFLIFRDHLKLITYVNLTSLEEKGKILKFYVEKIDILCYSLLADDVTCSGSQELERIKQKLAMLKTDSEAINDMIGRFDDETHFNNRGARVVRGVFNFVGQLAKILFGTLSESDANYYNAQIDFINDNLIHLTNIYKEKISIMQPTINEFSNQFTENKKKFEEIDYNLNKLEELMLKNTRNLTQVQINTEVNSYLLECTGMLFEYELELKTFTDAILLARRGLLHPKILTPRELFNKLKDSHYKINSKIFPVKLQPDQFNNLIDVSDLSVFYKNHRLVYVLEIPLIEQNNFILYQAIPLPVKQNKENVYAFVNPSHKYIGLRTDKQLYTHLTEKDIDKCKKINDTMICRQSDLLYPTSKTHTCESILLKTARLESILKVCDVRLTKMHNTFWYQLKTANSWLYSAPREETLHILCNDDNPHQTQLISTGLVRLSPECQAFTDYAYLHSQTVITVDATEKDFIPNVNLTISMNKLYENIKKYNVNISDSQLLNISKTSYVDINLLKTASSSLSELYKRADEIDKHRQTRTLYAKTLSWFHYILYTIIGLVIISVTILVINKWI